MNPPTTERKKNGLRRNHSRVVLRRADSDAKLQQIRESAPTKFDLAVSSHSYHVEGGLTCSCLVWKSETPIELDFEFSSWLSFQGGVLCLGNLSLCNDLILKEIRESDVPCWVYNSDLIDASMHEFLELYETASRKWDTTFPVEICYALKANSFCHVLRRTVSLGCSVEVCTEAEVDLLLSLICKDNFGLAESKSRIIINGLKLTERFVQKCVNLCLTWPKHLLVIDSLQELETLLNLQNIASVQKSLQVGLRIKVREQPVSLSEMDKLVSRFGLDSIQLMEAAKLVEESEFLELKALHAMGGKCSDIKGFIARSAFELYLRVKRFSPTLEFLDVGGGMPGGISGLNFDYSNCISASLKMIADLCPAEISPPKIIAEFGSYLVSSHGCLIFRVIGLKQSSSGVPWYIVNGSIMNSLPDVWALADHFAVLPISSKSKGPYQRVLLGGMTCDEDDVYPPPGSSVELFLPCDIDGLEIAFCGVGAYEQMLSGNGIHHCSVREPSEFLFDKNMGLRKNYKSQRNFSSLLGYETDE